MGLLQLAGAVGGMGTGLGKGLEQMNQGIITSGLQQDERKFADEKLKQQMAHAESLQQISEAGQNKRSGEQMAHAESLQKIGEEGQNKRLGAQINAAADLSFDNRATQESIAKENVLSQKEIHAATNEANKEIHRLMNIETRHATDVSSTNSKQATIAKVIDIITDENTRYELLLNDLKSDPNNPEYKNVVKKRQKNNLYLEAYRQRLGELSGATIPTPVERPALVLPRRSAAPGATPSTDALDQSSSAAPTNPNPFSGVSTAVPDQAGLAERAAGAFMPGMSILKGILKK